jgi:hypothetical protein
MPCLFCGHDFDPKGGPREKTDEHVFPDWSRPYLQKDESERGSHWHWKQSGEEREERTFRGVPAQQTIGDVCKLCNNGWMSDIETRVKPYLVPAMQGKGRTFGKQGQLELATWALKTALVIGAKGGYVPTPAEFLRDFERKRRPEAKARVWIGATPQDEWTYIDSRRLKVVSKGDEPPAAANAHVTVLAIGHVAFYVVGWSVRKPRMEFVYRDFGGSLRPIWPSRGPVDWPPPQILSRKGLDRLADGYGSL